MVWILIFVSCTCLVFVYLFIVQFLRSSKLEEIVNIVLQNMQTISDYINSSKELLGNPRLEEAFANDDEIGAFFTNLKEIQETLNQFVISSENENERKL